MKKKLNRQEYLRKWLIKNLRRLSIRWPERYEAIKRTKTKIEVGKFKNGKIKYKTMNFCTLCGIIVDPKEIQVDHIIPIIEFSGFKDWNNYIDSLFCDINNLQSICSECHSLKSALENKKRQKIKKKLAKKK